MALMIPLKRIFICSEKEKKELPNKWNIFIANDKLSNRHWSSNSNRERCIHMKPLENLKTRLLPY